MEWPFTSRESILRRLVELLERADARGITIVGEVGVGKSRLALEFVRAAEARGRATELVAASRATASIPYGAFAHLFVLPPAESDELRLLGDIRAELAGRSTDTGPIVLVVDDAHLLDDPSSRLVHHLATRDAAFIVLTSRADAPVPSVITDLWKDGILERVELAALSRAAADALLEAALGGGVEPLTLASLWRRSRGNPLYLRELVLGGIETGNLVRESSGWRLIHDGTPSVRLIDLVESRLGVLDRTELSLVQALAVGGSIDLRAFEGHDETEALERLDQRRLIAVDRSGNRERVSLAHPVYAEVIAAAMPRTLARRLMARLADRLEFVGARRRDDLLRLARLRLDGGGVAAPGMLTSAAKRALAVFDVPLAERLARAALAARPADVSAQLLLGRAMTNQERVDEADAVFVTAAADAMSDEEIASVALAHANLLYFRARRTTDAASILAAASHRVGDADWRDEIDSMLVLFRAGAGDPAGVAEAGRRLAARADARPRAVVHAVLYASLANVMLGRFTEAEKQARIGLDSVPRTREELPLAGAMLQINRAMANAYAGRVARSLETSRTGYGDAVEAGIPEVASLWGMILAECQMLTGQIGEGRQTMVGALARARERDPFSSRATGAAIASVLSSWLGRHDEARELRQEIIAHGLAHDVPSRIQFDRATVWFQWPRAGADAAAREAVAAADRAAADAHLVWAAWLLHDAVRLGRPDLVGDRLGVLSRSIEGDLVPTMVAHAEALSAGDAAALDGVSARFEHLGCVLFAAEAAAQAHRAHLRRGEPRLARVAAARMSLLAARCPDVTTPPLADTARVVLTTRELEVARLAAAGLPSRAIGQRLRISVRTVDNHLGAVYGKLGVVGRAGLSASFGPSALRGEGMQ